MAARRKSAKYSYVARRAAAARGTQDTPGDDNGYESDGDVSAFGGTPALPGGTDTPAPRPGRVRFTASAGGGSGPSPAPGAGGGVPSLPQRHFSMVDLELQGRDVARALLLMNNVTFPAPAAVGTAGISSSLDTEPTGAPSSVLTVDTGVPAGAVSTVSSVSSVAAVLPGLGDLGVGDLGVGDLLDEAQAALALPDNDDSGEHATPLTRLPVVRFKALVAFDVSTELVVRPCAPPLSPLVNACVCVCVCGLCVSMGARPVCTCGYVWVYVCACVCGLCVHVCMCVCQGLTRIPRRTTSVGPSHPSW
jgi:hypothetical protein